jgi:predicted dehydrogenase
MGSPGFAFAAIGLNHGHIYGQTEVMIKAGCRLKAFFAPEDDLAAAYAARFPDARRVADERAILDDPEILLVIGAGVLADRAPMAVRAMRHGKDVMLDKPGATTLEQLAELRRAQAETGRILSILYSEHYTQPTTVAAGELIKAGAIGRVLQTIGLGPHRIGNYQRPDWFWKRERTGGILTDIGSHQVEQFLFFTGSDRAEIVASQVANFDHPDTPEFEDFGDIVLRSDHAAGYIRVDWFTAGGLPMGLQIVDAVLIQFGVAAAE